MDQRASIPVTLPRLNPTVSIWQDPPDTIADLRSTPHLPDIADVVVIGSGISGASTAFGLSTLSNAGSVVMLEARQACSGATGRNGGHTKAASYRNFYSNVDTLGAEEAIKLVRLEYNNIKNVQAFSRLHEIECELFSRDTVDIIYDQAQWDDGVRSIGLMRKLMPKDLEGASKYTFHTAEEARDRFHCRGDKVIGAISYQAGSLSAYKLVIGILKICLKNGLNLQTNTPATSLQQSKNGYWEIQTPRGLIKAMRVVLATNGYTSYLVENLHSVIVPLRGQITAHRLGLNMPKDGLQTTYSFMYGNGYEYMISRPKTSKHAGDIIMGGGLTKAREEGLYEFGTTDDTTLDSDIHQWLVGTTPRYFGGSWGDDQVEGRIRQEWTGIMGYSSDGFPFVGEVPQKNGLFLIASFQGNGMVLCFMCARALLQIMGKNETGLDDWFPRAFRITEERMRNKFQRSPRV